MSEWSEFNTVQLRPELVVDRDRGKRLDINLDILFPRMPCDVMSLDIMDVSGEMQLDITKSGLKKFRLDSNGATLGEEEMLVGLKLQASRSNAEYCGPCYGALDQNGNEGKKPEDKVCCNNCDEVREAYVRANWAFYDGKNVEQCESEGYVERINLRLTEGCRVKGTVSINRVAGNLHVAPGASFSGAGQHTHDLSLYDQHPQLTFEHVINHLSFGQPIESDEMQISTHPLDGLESKRGRKYHSFSYFVKVVSTRHEFLNGTVVETNQFSATKHDRPLSGGKDEDHQHTVHLRGGVPAVFFYMEISPVKVINKEVYKKTWGSFVLGVCSIIGGVLTIGGALDRAWYAADKAIRGKKDT